jgi:hypothetical protein
MEMNDDTFLATTSRGVPGCRPQEIELMHDLG